MGHIQSLEGFSVPETKTASIRIVHPGEFDSGTAQTSGSLRKAAIDRHFGIDTHLWGGTFFVEPGGKTGIHHHGEQETIVYILEGSSLIRWGDAGEFQATANAGDFVHVPAWLPHQEINPSADAPFRWIVVRSTPEPIVVNLPNDFWG
jgi:uncharacterized RmlC-like cupin family protein